MFARKHYDKDYLYLANPTQFLSLQYKGEEGKREREGREREKSSLKMLMFHFPRNVQCLN
jgi:hypothetical protein